MRRGSSSPEDILYKPGQELAQNLNDYQGFLDSNINNIGIANTTNDIALLNTPVYLNPSANLCKVFCEGNLVCNIANQVPGMNYMSVFHDKWATVTPWINGNTPAIVATILPSIPLVGVGLLGGVGTGIVSSQINKSNKNPNKPNTNNILNNFNKQTQTLIDEANKQLNKK